FLVPGISRHYVRINPVDVNNPEPDDDPDHGQVLLRNRKPGERYLFPAAEIVDAGFLELVRYGIRKAGDPLMEDSLRVIDAVLKADLPGGPCWRRYTHDGYGQRDDGGAFDNWGVGRLWPLLTGERAHYELAAGRDIEIYIRALEAFANSTRLLPEQIWDRPDQPENLLFYGGPTGSAMPLMWAHAEYVKLLRSAADGEVFDFIPEVAERFNPSRKRPRLEVWKFNRRIRSIAPGARLRIQSVKPFMLHWTKDEWAHSSDTHSRSTNVAIEFADIDIEQAARGAIRFTFYWPAESRWEGRDYAVEIKST
ncbi:MAG: glycoside hydrolase family 15 protein, partial [Candidatus Binataceae bacterium]